jgi:putative transposase
VAAACTRATQPAFDVKSLHAKIGELTYGDRGALSLSANGETEAEAQDLSCLLRGMEITRPNQVWAMDITYIPMGRGFVYLAVVLDWFSRRVLAWRLSNTTEASFCVETLEDALARHGKPEIFNMDQGSQFTGAAFTGVLANKGIAISMDGNGAWRDNIFVERLWRSIKYEEVYWAYEPSARPAPQSAATSDGATPDQAYFNAAPLLGSLAPADAPPIEAEMLFR